MYGAPRRLVIPGPLLASRNTACRISNHINSQISVFSGMTGSNRSPDNRRQEAVGQHVRAVMSYWRALEPDWQSVLVAVVLVALIVGLEVSIPG